MQSLRQALSKCRGLMAASSQGWGVMAAAPLETRPLSSLLTLRNFHQERSDVQQAAAAPAEAPGSSKLPPWAPTRELAKRKVLPKRMAHLLQVIESEREAEAKASKKLPDFKAGDILELKLSVPENKRRVTTFKGICIARSNRGYRTTFTLRNVFGAGGIERTFPLYSPHILEMKVTDSLPVRRAKLYYLRDRKMNKF